MSKALAEQVAADGNYVGVDPELPCLDHFVLSTVHALPDLEDEQVHAFIRAGLFRSFTSRKVLSAQDATMSAYNANELHHNEKVFCSLHLQQCCITAIQPSKRLLWKRERKQCSSK